MKRILTMGIVAAGMLAAAHAQDGGFVAPKPKDQQVEPVRPKPAKVTIEGVVAEIFKSRQPLQMVNPFAPKEYGTGRQNLSRDPVTGKPEGFIVFGIQW